jgi:signal transduction histidine kinase
MAVGLFADLLWGRWTQTAVAALVVDLGDLGTGGTLRDRLARTLGDPTLVVGYWLPEEGRYVDDAARPVELPTTGEERALTPIDDDGRRIAALIHDPAALDDPELTSAVAAATRLAVSNARLQAEVRARVAAVESSRRRIVEAGDAQRHRLGLELRDGAQRRLDRISELLADSGEPLADLQGGLAAARTELREFARGIHPATLTEHGLAAALDELVRRSPTRVAIAAPAGRFPTEVEAAAYFVCAEGLANALKYAGASRLSVLVQREDRHLVVSVEDDGAGGADAARGTGLRGLADRVEALGGELRIESPPGKGTRLVAALPLGE